MAAGGREWTAEEIATVAAWSLRPWPLLQDLFAASRPELPDEIRDEAICRLVWRIKRRPWMSFEELFANIMLTLDHRREAQTVHTGTSWKKNMQPADDLPWHEFWGWIHQQAVNPTSSAGEAKPPSEIPEPSALDALVAADKATQDAHAVASLYAVASPQQREILDLISQGYSDSEIATSLGCSRRTVRTHKTRLTKKIAGN